MNIKTKQIEGIESYFKTDNLHYNSFMFKMVCKALKTEFKNLETLLHLFSTAIDTFMELHDRPLKAIQNLQSKFEKEKITFSQKQFLFNLILKHLNDSEFYNNLKITKEQFEKHLGSVFKYYKINEK